MGYWHNWRRRRRRLDFRPTGADSEVRWTEERSPYPGYGLTDDGRLARKMPGRAKEVEGRSRRLRRPDPRLEAEGKNPFQLDSKDPDWSKFQDFLKSEVRYSSLMKENPEHAEALFQAAEQNAKWRLAGYKRLAAQGN